MYPSSSELYLRRVEDVNVSTEVYLRPVEVVTGCRRRKCLYTELYLRPVEVVNGTS